ncbi:hypothetical protein JCM3765_002812 [Sporobolomyces pararoseus]
MDTSSSNRPPRLRRKSSAFKLSLSRSSQSSSISGYAQAVQPPPPPTPSLPLYPDESTTTQEFTFILPSPSNTPDSPFESRMFPSSSSSQTPSSSSIISSTNTTTTNGGGTITTGSFPNVPSPSLTSTLELLKQLVNKRLTAWNYLKNFSQGKIYWFNTILLTTEELKKHFQNSQMRSRSTRFTIFSMSLSSLLISSSSSSSSDGTNHQQQTSTTLLPPGEFLRSLLNVLQEFDGIPEEKFGIFFTSPSNTLDSSTGSSGLGLGGNGAVGGGGIGGITGSSSGSTSLKSGQKSLFKLNSSKSKTGNKDGNNSGSIAGGGGGGGIGISNSGGIGNNNTTGSGNAHSTSGGGGGADFAFGGGEGIETGSLFIPNIPFELDYLQVLTSTCDLLIQVYTKIGNYLGMNEYYRTPTGGVGGGVGGGGGAGGALSQSLAELVLKIDSKLKKLISLLSKEVDGLARISIKNELELLTGGIQGWDSMTSGGGD